jgi:hypothetical protein
MITTLGNTIKLSGSGSTLKIDVTLLDSVIILLLFAIFNIFQLQMLAMQAPYRQSVKGLEV